MALKSRLLTTAFILPLAVSLSVTTALTPARAFELKPDTDDTDYPSYTSDTVKTGTDGDGDSIILNGTPADASNAGLLIDSNEEVIISGPITIRDRDTSEDGDEDVLIPLTDAIGIKVDTGFGSGNELRLKDGAQISIIEVRPSDYDGDDDDLLPDANDDDEDGIIEGSPALDNDPIDANNNHKRIGLWVESGNTLTEALIGEAGSSITVYGNDDDASDDPASNNASIGVLIDGDLSSYLDLSTSINMFGDNAVGVDIAGQIGLSLTPTYYRQRGDIDVRGKNGVGIRIGSQMYGSLIIDGGVNATGYSTISGSIGGPVRGGADFADDDNDEFSAQQIAANPNERRQARAAVEISAVVSQGIIINGPVNRVRTEAETDDFTCLESDSDCSADGITKQRNDGNDVTSLKDEPHHYDENRPGFNPNGATSSPARLTSYGESEATLLIRANVGTTTGGTKETFLDTVDDDNDDSADDANDEADLYDSTQEFFFSHGLMVRNWIEANGLYDSVNNGNGYVVDRPATALKLDNSAIINGGVFNSGIISARAYNADAIAIDLVAGKLTDGLRENDEVFLNEGTIQARIDNHTRSYVGIERDTKTATAVRIGSGIMFEDLNTNPIANPVFVNSGTISAISTHTHDDDDNDVYDTIRGLKANAFDLTTLSTAFDLTQRLVKADVLVDGSTDENDNVEVSDNDVNNPFEGSGDLDIDANGDGVIDTRDVAAPSILGDVKFGAGANVFAVKAGTVGSEARPSLISFGDGADDLILSNEIPDDEADDYTAPITTVTGRLKNGTGNLSVTIEDRAQLHLIGQEGVDLNGDGDDDDANEEFSGFDIFNLDLNDNAELRFSINPDFLDVGESVLDVTSLTLSDDAKINPGLTSLFDTDAGTKTVKLIGYNALTKSNPIADYLADETPFIFNVALTDASNTISAEFNIKTGADLGLNKSETAALPAVIKHFNDDGLRETSLTALTDGDDFRTAYGQLFPHYSDGTAQQLASMAEAATGAVSQHLQLVAAGGRRGGDGWVQQFGDYRKQDAGADNGTVSGTSYGITLGYDLPAGPIEAMGLFAQINFTAVNEKTTSLNEVKSDGTSFGAYIADALGPLRYELNAAYGLHDLESSRIVNFNDLADRATGSWDATSTSASARFAYPIFEDEYLLRLEAGMDYFALAHDDYTETDIFGRGFAMQLKDGESEKTTSFIGLRGGKRSGGGNPVDIVWEPNYYLGLRSVTDENPYTATANFVGTDEAFTLQNFVESEDALDVGLGIAAHNDYFAFEFNYRGQFADGVETHGGGVSIRLLF